MPPAGTKRTLRVVLVGRPGMQWRSLVNEPSGLLFERRMTVETRKHNLLKEWDRKANQIIQLQRKVNQRKAEIQEIKNELHRIHELKKAQAHPPVDLRARKLTQAMVQLME